MNHWPRNYVKLLCDIFNARHGAGAAVGKEILFGFVRLKKAGADWPRVVMAWQLYVAKEEPRWQRVESFVRRWQTWLEPTRSAVERAFDNAVGERRLRDAVQAALGTGTQTPLFDLPQHEGGGEGRRHHARRVRSRSQGHDR